jgi:hypothetical protein
LAEAPAVVALSQAQQQIPQRKRKSYKLGGVHNF